MLDIYSIRIDGKGTHWYNKSYRMTESQFTSVACEIKPETKAAYADEAENQGRTPDG